MGIFCKTSELQSRKLKKKWGRRKKKKSKNCVLHLTTWVHKINFFNVLLFVVTWEMIIYFRSLARIVAKLGYRIIKQIKHTQTKNKKEYKIFSMIRQSMWFIHPRSVLTLTNSLIKMNKKNYNSKSSRKRNISIAVKWVQPPWTD